MNTAKLSAIGALAIGTVWSAGAARASDIQELEANQQAINNDLANAQFIGAGAFTNAASPDIFGSLPTASIRGFGGIDDVDFFAFDSAPGSAYFDIDGGAFDTALALFDASGNLLAGGDDSFPADPGSVSDLDAFIGSYVLPAQGRYYVVVSHTSNGANALFTGTDFSELARPDGAFGGFAFTGIAGGDASYPRSGLQDGLAYTLHVTIPAPGATAAMAIGALALSSRRRSR